MKQASALRAVSTLFTGREVALFVNAISAGLRII
jgi:hypothetical protein